MRRFISCCENVFHLPASLAIQQSVVLCDLYLQSGLDVQEDAVLRALSLQVCAELSQLNLQAAHLRLEPGQHASEAGLRLGECELQVGFL